MPTRTLVAALAVALLAACAGTPMNHDLLRRHAERNCRAQSAVAPAYAIGDAATTTRNIAYARCLRTAGFAIPEPAKPSREA